VAQLSANAFGEVLVPGGVLDCYRVDSGDHDQAAGVLVVAPASLLTPASPSQAAPCCTSL
jgi:hypothetical protein